MLFTNLNKKNIDRENTTQLEVNKMAEGKAKSSSDAAGVNNGEVFCF